MQKKYLLPALIISLFLISFTSCNLFKVDFSDYTSIDRPYIISFEQKQISSDISIVASASKACNSRSNQKAVEDTSFIELWVMPTRRGVNEPIAHDNVYDIKKYSPLEDGSFEIPKEELPDITSVVFIVDTENPEQTQVLGFLTLKVDDTNSIIEFPPRNEIIGSIEFGEVKTTGDSTYISDTQHTLDDNSAAFNAEIFNKMHDNAVFHNVGLMALNILMNTNSDSEEDFYAPGVSIQYDLNLNAPAASSAEVGWKHIELHVYSSNTDSHASLFAPDGTNLNGEGVFPAAYGPQSSVQYGTVISIEDFRNYAKPGELWKLIDDQGVLLAEFDMSAAMLTDNQGYPIIPIPNPDYTLITNENFIDTINFNWFYFHPDGTTKEELKDQTAVDRLIGKSEFWLQNNSTNTVTYMYRDPDPEADTGFGAMKGNVISANTLSPALSESSFNKNMSFGYLFTLFKCGSTWNESKIPSYKVTFDCNNGSDVTLERVISGSILTEPENPTREGFSFTGWYSDADLNNLWDFTTDTVTADKTLYAGWAINNDTASITLIEKDVTNPEAIEFVLQNGPHYNDAETKKIPSILLTDQFDDSTKTLLIASSYPVVLDASAGTIEPNPSSADEVLLMLVIDTDSVGTNPVTVDFLSIDTTGIDYSNSSPLTAVIDTLGDIGSYVEGEVSGTAVDGNSIEYDVNLQFKSLRKM